MNNSQNKIVNMFRICTTYLDRQILNPSQHTSQVTNDIKQFEVKVYTYLGIVRNLYITDSNSFCLRAYQRLGNIATPPRAQLRNFIPDLPHIYYFCILWNVCQSLTFSMRIKANGIVIQAKLVFYAQSFRLNCTFQPEIRSIWGKWFIFNCTVGSWVTTELTI